ncbi:hypothetical protein EXIGLDRAFT_841022 [Exidia glandulosa HHB12029]|uniref:NACHT domain-containing protein n=1 Tax=Exidia glandulosa HHB12029 TaxID=1314781 RepID=A0A165E4R9_EXIGL|nr:hypothetical protein EXIGLDRAFT_841022 [Exidia glandulosa HHB12029]
MPLESTFAVLRVFAPSVQAIPVAGPALTAVIDVVLALYDHVEQLKINSTRARDLVEREGHLSYTIALHFQSLTASQAVELLPHIKGLQVILEETRQCLAKLQPSSPASRSVVHKAKHFVKHVAARNTDAEQLRRLERRVDDAVQRFQVGSLLNDNVDKIRAVAAHEMRYLEDVLKPVHEAAFDSHTSPSGCFEGTRTSLLQEASSWAFDSGGERVFWISGLAGTGKSAIAKSLCERLQRARCPADLAFFANSPKCHLVTFFICRHVAERRDPLRILHTIACRLAREIPEYRLLLHKALSEPDLLSKRVQEQVATLIEGPLALCSDLTSRIVLVIDAFDECDKVDGREGGDLLPSLLGVIRRAAAQVRLVFTSRNESSIHDMFAQCRDERSLRLHDIDKAIVDRDIEAYLAHHLLQLKQHGVGSREIRSLTERANGLFIYAATIVRFVQTNRFFPPRIRVASLLKLIGSSAELHAPVPKYGLLDNMYTQILRRALSPDELEHDIVAAAGVFRSVVTALAILQDQVTLSALAHLLDLDVDQISEVLKGLYSILLVDETQTIRLYHVSVSEFLLDPKRCTDDLFRVNQSARWSLAAHHGRLALGCIRVMNAGLREDICDIGDPGMLKSDIRDLHSRIHRSIPSELSYASRSWYIHLAQSPAISELPLYGLARDFLEILDLFAQDHMAHWIELVCWTMSTWRETDWARRPFGARIFLTFQHSCTIQIVCYMCFTSPLPLHLSRLLATVSDALKPVQRMSEAPPLWSPISFHVALSDHATQNVVTATSDDGTRIASVESGTGVDGTHMTLRILDAQSGHHVYLRSRADAGCAVSCTSIAPTGRFVAVGFQGRQDLHVWDESQRRLRVHSIPGCPVSLNFSPCGMRLRVLSLGVCGTIRLLTLTLDDSVLAFKLTHHDSIDHFSNDRHPACLLSPCGTYFAVVTSSIQVWSESLEEPLLVLQPEGSSPVALSFAPPTQEAVWLAMSSANHDVILWCALTRRHVASLLLPHATT